VDAGVTDSTGDSCNSYDDYPTFCGNYDDSDFSSEDMCCGCGGGDKGSCVDADTGITDLTGDSCNSYDDYPTFCGNYDDNDFSSEDVCCACGGGDQTA
jgi:hypothetical protein